MFHEIDDLYGMTFRQMRFAKSVEIGDGGERFRRLAGYIETQTVVALRQVLFYPRNGLDRRCRWIIRCRAHSASPRRTLIVARSCFSTFSRASACSANVASSRSSASSVARV